MFGAWFIGRSALRAARNRNITPHGPQYVQPYRGRYKKTYNGARLVVTVACLIPVAILLIALCLAKLKGGEEMEEIRGLIRSHPKSMIAVALFMFVALIGGASNALGGTRTVTKAVPGPVVTVTQAAKPAVTITPRPAPTVTLTPRPAPTVTVTPVPGPGTVLFSGTGSGDWNSAPFAVAVSEAGPVIRVTYSYWNNGSMGSADNFEADLVGGPDSEPIANTIAFSGRNTTTVYLDTQYAGTNKYHLEVVGSGSWSFRITQVS